MGEVDVQFAPVDISIKLAIAIGIGMLVGLEREWSQKDLGTRTFTIVAIAGALSILASPPIAYITFAGVLLIVLLTALHNVREGRSVEATTSAAVILTFVLGVLIGQGHHYTPVAAAIVMTLLLSLKPALTHFAGGLLVTEVRSAVSLGLLAFVIYPVLPNRTVDAWGLLNPREAWLIIVVIAALGFVNYVLLKMFGSRGLNYSAILGGLVNSTAAIAELAGSIKNQSGDIATLAVTIDLLTVVAMFVRNLLILAIFAPPAVASAAGPMIAMTITAAVYIWSGRKNRQGNTGLVRLSSPLSLGKVFQFGFIFIAIEIAGSLAQRYFGHLGFLLVSLIGGLVSSASTVGAAATLAMHRSIDMQTAGFATVLTSMTSALSNLPIMQHEIRDWAITRKVVVVSCVIVGFGILTMLVTRAFP
ncbi:MAG: MgtC/SapB family protein [Bryobacterales bacterium]|nr:MgtC/SapB family protein [Bryobacterales bacterium]